MSVTADRFERMFARPTAELRDELLALNGVGPETADSILLYAGNHPVFVVDAYTRRILERHEIVSSAASYDEIRQLFEQALGETTPPKQSLDGAPAAVGIQTASPDRDGAARFVSSSFARQRSRAHRTGPDVQ